MKRKINEINNDENIKKNKYFPNEILSKIMKIGLVYQMAYCNKFLNDEAQKFFIKCALCTKITSKLTGYINCCCDKIRICHKCAFEKEKQIKTYLTKCNNCYEITPHPDEKVEYCNNYYCSNCKKHSLIFTEEPYGYGHGYNTNEREKDVCYNCYQNYGVKCRLCSKKIKHNSLKCKKCYKYFCFDHLYNRECLNCLQCSKCGKNQMPKFKKYTLRLNHETYKFYSCLDCDIEINIKEIENTLLQE